MVSEEGSARIWARLDELKEMMIRMLAIQGERDKDCARHDGCIVELKNRVRALEINQARWTTLAALGASLLTAVVNKYFVG